MTTPKKLACMTVEEYLAYEDRAPVKHEYVDGLIFAMSGVTKKHNLIAGNVYTRLRSHLRGSRCRAYVADVKLRMESTNSFYYPDVMVSCEKYDDKSVFTTSPVLVVEVLSRSTASIDRREKVLAYRQIESLNEYLIVHQRKRRVELHRRREDGSWEILGFGQGEELSFEVLNRSPVGALELSIDAIYEDVAWQSDDSNLVRENARADEWLDGDNLDDENLDW